MDRLQKTIKKSDFLIKSERPKGWVQGVINHHGEHAAVHIHAANHASSKDHAAKHMESADRHLNQAMWHYKNHYGNAKDAKKFKSAFLDHHLHHHSPSLSVNPEQYTPHPHEHSKSPFSQVHMKKSLKLETDKDRFQKAISKAQHLLGQDALVKSRGDALCHHAAHAQAAKVAGDKDAGEKHEFMFLRHALEHARKNPSRYGGIAQKLKSTIDHHNTEAADEIGDGYGDSEGHPKLKHHKSKKGFVPHKEDQNFQEDYDQGDGPGRIRKSLTSYDRACKMIAKLKG